MTAPPGCQSPSVVQATVSNQPPPGVFSRSTFAIGGQTSASASTLPTMFYSTVGSGFRETLGIHATTCVCIGPVPAPVRVAVDGSVVLQSSGLL